jgi:hypothetical protein
VLLYAMQTREDLCPSVASGHDFLALGRSWTGGLVPLQSKNTVGHDVGFLSMPFLAELERNPTNATAVNSTTAFGIDLRNRYNAVVGCTRSWDSSDPSDFQVIIDNLMNLELFFALEKLTGDSYYRKMAITHADQTLLNHLRPDGGSYHVVHYNGTTGKVIKRVTSQGYSDSSTWSRGQAWAIYGYANMHKHTSNLTYLATARKLGSYFLKHIPSTGIVPWDFQAPTPAPADTSAAMVATSGMLLIAQQETAIGNNTGATWWSNQAMKLYSDNVKFGWRSSWASLLANGTVNNPASNNMTGIIYDDYYMIAGGNTMVQMGLAQCP